MNVSTLPGRAALWAVSISLGLCGDAAAHNAAYPIASKVAKVDQRGDFSRHKLVFKTENDPLISPVHSPAVNGAVFLLRWEGENSGRTPLIGLPASHWTGTGRPAGSKGYKYLDKKTTQGPVSKAVFKAGSWRKGGSVSLQAKGGDWPWTLDGGVTTLWFYFGVRNETQPEDIEWYCTKFGDGAGEVKADGQEGMFLARNSPAPDSCPDFCGDGKIDQGEQCDDGNLDETDGCLNTCQLGSCDGGREYDSTWEAVQDQIISEGGCLGCHSGTGPLGAKGELDLDPDVAYGNLINVDAKLYPSHKLITPGAEDRSFFYNKLSAKTYGTPSVPGSPMPGGGLPAILDNQLQGLREWIRSGASETASRSEPRSISTAVSPTPDPIRLSRWSLLRRAKGYSSMRRAGLCRPIARTRSASPPTTTSAKTCHPTSRCPAPRRWEAPRETACVTTARSYCKTDSLTIRSSTSTWANTTGLIPAWDNGSAWVASSPAPPAIRL